MKASALGELQYESFNAAEARITVRGRKSHTGFARGQMVNAGRLALEFLQLLPPEEIPEMTSGNEGFFHLSEIDGSIDQAKMLVQVRDHDKGQFEARKKLLSHFIDRMNEEYPDAFQLDIQDLYYNMLDAIEPHMHMVEAAARSMVAMGIKPLVRPIRGGNLSVDLSRQGLPCISLFTGGHNFNGPFEYISLDSMEKAVQVITRIASFTEKHHRN
jgi:tripeptide aminopeptidase